MGRSRRSRSRPQTLGRSSRRRRGTTHPLTARREKMDGPEKTSGQRVRVQEWATSSTVPFVPSYVCRRGPGTHPPAPVASARDVPHILKGGAFRVRPPPYHRSLCEFVGVHHPVSSTNSGRDTRGPPGPGGTGGWVSRASRDWWPGERGPLRPLDPPRRRSQEEAQGGPAHVSLRSVVHSPPPVRSPGRLRRRSTRLWGATSGTCRE